jgi:hypothetical protein
VNTTGLIDLIAGVDLNSAEMIAATAAVIVALAITALLLRKLRRFGAATAVTAAVNIIVLGTTIQAAVVLAKTRLDIHGIEAAFPAVLFEAVAIRIWLRARAYAARHGRGPGPWAGRLYLIGLIAGTIVSTSGTNVAAGMFRFAAPIIGVWLLVLDLTPDDAETQPASFRWGPVRVLRRIAIRFQLVDAGDGDVANINSRYVTDRLVRVGLRYERLRGAKKGLRGWRCRRTELALIKLGVQAGDEEVAAAADRIHRGTNIGRLLNPAMIAQSRAEADKRADIERTLRADIAALQADIHRTRQDAADVRSALTEADTDRARQAGIIADLRTRLAEADRTCAALRQEVTHARSDAETAARTADRLEVLLTQAQSAPAAQTRAGVRRQSASATGRGTPPGPDRTAAADRAFLPAVDGVAPDTVALIAAARRRTPDATQEDIADAIGRNVRTVRRAWAATEPGGQQDTATGHLSARINGAAPAALTN